MAGVIGITVGAIAAEKLNLFGKIKQLWNHWFGHEEPPPKPKLTEKGRSIIYNCGWWRPGKAGGTIWSSHGGAQPDPPSWANDHIDGYFQWPLLTYKSGDIDLTTDEAVQYTRWLYNYMNSPRVYSVMMEAKLSGQCKYCEPIPEVIGRFEPDFQVLWVPTMPSSDKRHQYPKIPGQETLDKTNWMKLALEGGILIVGIIFLNSII